MSELICEKHKVSLECLGGVSAHPDNWYCPICDEITRLQAENERLREAIILMAEDGWLIHGPEGMDETQQKIYDIYVSFNNES